MAATADITLGYMPLFDSAVLIAAVEKGFAGDEGLSVQLVRETSWANIRDRIAVGHFQAAHMLAPMPIASNLGLTPLSLELVAPFALGLGGNAVTVSRDLWARMAADGAGPGADPSSNGASLKRVVESRHRSGEPLLRFAVVHPFSGHNYELRYWLAACGIDPEKSVEIVVVPPPLMADALSTGAIDGFCAGEPWNSVAVAAGAGRIATTKASIWRLSPEKVLGVSARFASENRPTLDALLRALYRSSIWCGDRANHGELAALMSAPSHLGLPREALMPILTGQLTLGDGAADEIPEFFVPHAKAASFPWQSHALWFYSQMVRWGHVQHSPAQAERARNTYRPDIYRQALKPLAAPMPGANMKVEGALTVAAPVGASEKGLVLGPDGFFDGRIFDPDRLDDYLASQN
ncbi:NitT/TauT family transport system ATP-binding protein [Sinorhizobium kostiense]|uniref:NitT/TauT family transport system ATP-binding protein n=1 Tax=Sinorhizobium kostiense TaxID=76747 RepID=A0ABS4QUJ7_9HYPH|nr:CmpA/NrtA family ABC transporter substrate-binding protein [Sinorhizobium kostiense]MBP2234328.1 NitT/TauT family transport system ATP-binding protein [Sinorhizobium kostiense]